MTEPTVKMTMSGDILVDGKPEDLRAELSWAMEDPLLVTLDLAGPDNEAIWGVDRASLYQALTTDGLVGWREGDILMGGRLYSPYFILVLQPPGADKAYLRLPRPDVEAFLAITRSEMEIGSDEETEIVEAMVEDTLARMGQ